MSMIPVTYYLFLSAFLFCIGVTIMIVKRNIILILIGIELILNAANINLIAFSRMDSGRLEGHMLALLVIIIAAAEAAIGLAIVIRVARSFGTTEIDEINDLKER